MPGILPMKVIKVGTSSQSRIAQACDRCRSKKIRCDGIRPTCSQCANVGFECKTSDKLSRRAFPRGYTESLEERVRQLESEVRELKDLLDEKDEKIDMLSKMHGQRPVSASARASASASPRSPVSTEADGNLAPKQDVFRVQATPLLLGVENSDSYFMGSSSGRAFIESFKRKIQESGKPCGDFNPEAFLHIQGCYPLVAKPPAQSLRIPPRLFSDRCVNVYFQEWAPLFPVLHKPTFLQLYGDFAADSDKIKNNHKLAQLYLVFSIAALSSEQPDLEQIAACELQWQKALDAVIMDNTMHTLQCLVLALVYCTIRADYKRLQHFKAVAVGLSHRLGLHQSQKRFSFGALTTETRKKVFWTLYTLDCFSAAILGLPKLLREDDIHAEYPSDTDDEYVTEKGFQPTLPGEHTRISSALALFRLSRILARVLEKNYPAASSHELSLQQMAALDAEIREWDETLPAHLKLNFVQDKPSTDVTGSRSPILALAYYYARTLIYRPAIGSSLGPKAAPAMLAIADASKCIIQIVQLLEERGMSFSLCLNKGDVLVLCGMALLYQSLDLKHESKLMKEVERLFIAVLDILERARAPGVADLKRVAKLLIIMEEPPQSSPAQRRGSPPTAASHTEGLPYGRHIGASMSEADLLSQQEKLRRMTMPSTSGPRPEFYRAQSRASFDHAAATAHSPPQHDQHLSISQIQQSMMRMSPAHNNNSNNNKAKPHMEYLTLGNTAASGPQPPSPVSNHNMGQPQHMQSPHTHNKPQQTPQHYPSPHMNKGVAGGGISLTEWEALLGAMDGGQINVYDAIYGGPALSMENPSPHPAASNYTEWAHDPWDLSCFHVGDLEQLSSSATSGGPQSVLSMSDESLSSGDEHSAGDLYLLGSDDYQSSGLLSHRNSHDGPLMMEGLEMTLGL
ncbi:fungal-specific transcription factor domain-containing protein [Xylariaceae sp. FL0594]|nr:fungal-specific transcription factor domain-containing protein [Xylariaceae sp. FL0594]